MYNELTSRYQKTKELIVDYLIRFSTPVSAEDLYIKMKDEQQAICLSTVYRHLLRLEMKGEVAVITSASRTKFYTPINSLVLA